MDTRAEEAIPRADTANGPLRESLLPAFYSLGDSVVEVAFHEPTPPSSVPEVLTQSIWEQGRFVSDALHTSDGQRVLIRDPGRPNLDAGPDFLRATLRIGEMDWNGDIEIHNTSGQWFEHRHHLDARYNSVILHVTLYADVWTGRLTRADGTVIPEVVLYPLLQSPLRSLLYQFYAADRRPIPCAASWPEVDPETQTSLIESAGIRRLSNRIKQRLATGGGVQLERLLYERVFAALGYAKNSAPMVDLARRLPLDLVRTVAAEELEALYLGTAGLLPTPTDLLDADRATADRAMAYHDTFDRLRHLHGVSPMVRETWLFFRLRPANFPPLRIAQGAALVKPGGLLHDHPIERLIATCVDPKPTLALRKALEVFLPDFWQTHVRLDRRARTGSCSIGRERSNQIILNAILPVLMVLSEQKRDAGLRARVIDIARAIPAERNEVTRIFDALGTRAGNALESQGMYDLYRNHCLEARCLSCSVGNRILG